MASQDLHADLWFLRRKAAFYAELGRKIFGLQSGHSEYTRFIILSSARSGSNYVRSLLNSHRHLVAFGELFQRPEKVSWHLPGYFATPRQQRIYRTSPRRFLRKIAFGSVPGCITAAGFKIFYDHTGPVDRSPVWRCLAEDQDLKVLHLKRRNKLEQFLSWTRAVQTGQWVSRSSHLAREPHLQLDARDCLRWFEKVCADERSFDALFAKHDMIEVLYEDLRTDPVGTMEKVQDFLKIGQVELLARTHKQARQEPFEAISNYAELKKQFEGTRWEAFFEE